MNKPVLIFPAGMPRALDFLQKSIKEGKSVIGSSSLGYDASREKYPAWVHLPYVTDPGFDQALRHALIEFDIGEIYTPNIVVWNHLSQILGKLIPGVVLVNASPVDEVLSGYRAALSEAEYLMANQLPLMSDIQPRRQLSRVEVASLCRYTDLIPGMCDDDKFSALFDTSRYSVSGDIVEIGSWWGKSAFILAWLARCYEIGKLLCVDPWANEHLIQNEEMVDSGSRQVSADEALTVFQIGLLPFNANHMNYLRMTSVEGAAYYGENRSACTEIFGHTEYAGEIAILHIDGNHAYEAAKADVESWGKFVVGGGWIIIDDYIWPYGDGPRRVGDEFLENNRSRIAAAFVMGTALFIQLSLQD
ncbi:MAG: class I SAM-dependent methyltransferase [Propionivibrio sp.]|uniref:Class I SAM-dependent methyltransferase n=1 Tax=Candidatus Propionivibrio dominans TaxID=2954373 RepID=A0A9D7F4T2_9RHOO|nr:class I SAM-dependent methyltransferase [Candidatus Propionivibrio dominans]